MMKNNHGITLVSLVIEIIILMILAATGVTAVYIGINEFRDNKWYTELGVVRQAVVQQYALAQAAGKLEYTTSDETVSFWVGERIEPGSTISIPSSISSDDTNGSIFKNRLASYSPTYQEDYYYRLDEEALYDLNVANTTGSDDTASYTYIVNYSTGEVYNETKQVNSSSELLYLPSTVYDNSSTEENKVDFNDWN